MDDRIRRLEEELADARAQLRAVQLVKPWTNEDGRRFVFISDLQAALGLPAEDTVSEPERAR